MTIANFKIFKVPLSFTAVSGLFLPHSQYSHCRNRTETDTLVQLYTPHHMYHCLVWPSSSCSKSGELHRLLPFLNKACHIGMTVDLFFNTFIFCHFTSGK